MLLVEPTSPGVLQLPVRQRKGTGPQVLQDIGLQTLWISDLVESETGLDRSVIIIIDSTSLEMWGSLFCSEAAPW